MMNICDRPDPGGLALKIRPVWHAELNVQPAIDFFELALRQMTPSLAAHLLDKLEVPTGLYLVPWLLTLFSRSLPLSTACRVWDRVLAEGEAEAFKAALALLSLMQPVLLLAGFEEAVQLLQQLPFDGGVAYGSATPDSATADADASLGAARQRVFAARQLLLTGCGLGEGHLRHSQLKSLLFSFLL